MPWAAYNLLPLRGVRCRLCGYVSAPVQHFGCERCGARGRDLEEATLTGQAAVLAAVTVHEHPDPAVATPTVIGSVLLDEGPMLRARLAGEIDPGAKVAARVDSSGDAPVLVFGPESEE